MHPALQHDAFLVKEHVGTFRAANHYDIHDAETGELLIRCREPELNVLTRLLRFSDFKRLTPFDVELRAEDDTLIARVHRGIALFLSRVEVEGASGQHLGAFQQQLFSVGGRFEVFGPDDQLLCTLRGKWTSWEFRFEIDGQEFARVTKEWSGAGREFFTSADNYVLQIHDVVPPESPLRPLLLGAVVCIDMVLKE